MLIGLCGKSGTGKSSVVKEMEKLGYKRVVTDTTRPMREGEQHGVDYFFDTPEQFEELLNEGEFIETTAYEVANGETWKYGTSRGQLSEVGDKGVIVLNPDGVKAFREKNIPIKICLIESNDVVINKRLKARGDNPNEIARRMEADDEDFMDINLYADFQVYNEKDTELEDLAKMIIELVGEEL